MTKTKILLVTALVALWSVQTQAEPKRYVLDPDHLTIGFQVTHLGFAKVFGFFREASGSFTFDEDTGEISDVRVVVKTASVFTNVEARDRHLRSEDFLDVENHPEMVFEADRATLVDRQAKLAGRLTLRETTKPVTLEVTWNRSGPSPLPPNLYVAGMSARASFERSGFGLTYGLLDGLVGNEVEIVIEIEGQRQ